jgi:hypothetical protein
MLLRIGRRERVLNRVIRDHSAGIAGIKERGEFER